MMQQMLQRPAGSGPRHQPVPGGGRAAAAPASRRRVLRRARAAAATSPPAAAEAAAGLQADIIRLAGSKYGHDLSPEARQLVEQKVQELVALGLPVKGDVSQLTGTTWNTVYTNSDGTSSGKVGPFVTEVTQEFPADAPGVYYNVSTLGFVWARLRGRYGVTRDDRIDLEFENITLSVGPWQAAEKVFEPGAMRGHWSLKYGDDGFRAFLSNKGNLFVLRRLSP